MTTAQWIFERAMALMDELGESSGSADNADTKAYINRTLSILYILRMECLPFSDSYQVSDTGKRSVCPEITDFTSEIKLDDAICQGVLPYGLAAHLLLDENPDAASFFQQRYQEALTIMRATIPTRFETIGDQYGGIGFDSFGRW